MSKVEGSSEFQKFMRHFCSRLIQSTVQARMDQMVSHPSQANPDSPDWFNLVVDEIGEVAAYLKSNIKRYPPNCSALTLDFLLHTADGDQLPLESWVVRIDKGQTDENINVHTTLYNCWNCPSTCEIGAGSYSLLRYHQMSTLLKSVVMASRFTPTYRYYVRKQSPETFVIFYRIYEGEADLSQLGEGRRSKKIGCLPTPFGTIHLDLFYRMKMELLPTPFVETTNQGAQMRWSKPTSEHDGDPPKSYVLEHAAVPYSEANAVPYKGSETIVVGSPVSGDVNLFSASPMQGNDQGLPFTDGVNPPDVHLQQLKLGRSASSTTEMGMREGVESGLGRHVRRSSTESARSTETTSPHAPSSFPQRAAIHSRQLRIRNHSFPFASLLIDSQTAFEPTVIRSLLLPKVPEDSVIPQASSIHASHCDRALGRGTGRLRASSSLTSDIAKRLTCEDASSIKEEEGEDAAEPGSSRGRVIFACSPSDIDRAGSLMDEQERTISERIGRLGSGENLIDEDKMTTSDDSFVKVIAFASSEDLGSDLSEFVKEIRFAPAELRSFAGEETSNLSQELNHLRGRVDEFDTFVSTLKEMNSEK